MDPSSILLQPGLFATPLGRILLLLLAVIAVLLIGRIVLRVAWRLVTIAAFVVALLVLLTFLL